MTMTIEGQIDGIIELIYSFSLPIFTHHDSALFRTTTPAHYSLIPRVCHIDVACCIDQDSLRRRQLRQIAPATSSTRHDNPFFGVFHPFHHTMILPVRHVDSVFSIHTDEAWLIELMKSITLSISTSHHGATRLSSSIASHYMLLDDSDIERSFVIHRQSETIDVFDDCFSSSVGTSTWPSCHSTIVSIADDETVGLFVVDHVCRTIQLIRSIPDSVATGQHCTTRSISLPFHDAAIGVVSNDHRVLIIHEETVRPVELVFPVPFSVSSSDSGAVLCPLGIEWDVWTT